MADDNWAIARRSMQKEFKTPDTVAAPPAETTNAPKPMATPQPDLSALRDRADTAKEKYMQENNVDENGDVKGSPGSATGHYAMGGIVHSAGESGDRGSGKPSGYSRGGMIGLSAMQRRLSR